jgi:hypothetical protein
MMTDLLILLKKQVESVKETGTDPQSCMYRAIYMENGIEILFGFILTDEGNFQSVDYFGSPPVVRLR